MYNSKFSDRPIIKSESEINFNNIPYLTQYIKNIINIINISECLGRMFVSPQIQCSDTWRWWLWEG